MITRIVLIKIVFVIVVFVVSYMNIFSQPRGIADKARGEFTKLTMENYIKDNSVLDYSVGTPAWNHFLNVVKPDGDELRKKIIIEQTNNRLLIWALIMFVIALIPIFGYWFSIIFNGLLLVLVAIGYGGVLFLLPMISFIAGVYVRDIVLNKLNSTKGPE